MRWTMCVLCSCAMSAAIAQGVADHGEERSAGVKRALLIGINKYRAVTGLQGAVNDVETMREILTKRWGFLPGNITMLIDEGATREKMLAAIRQIVAISGPQDDPAAGRRSGLAGLVPANPSGRVDQNTVRMLTIWSNILKRGLVDKL